MKAVILAGGGGTRLWPLSTPEKPKQFQKLVSDKTMLEETIERLDFLDPSDIYLAINEKHLTLTKQQAPNIPEENIIIEPALRDTASCIGYAAAIIAKRHPEEVMAIIYADHLIQNKQEFQEKLQLAAKIAEQENTLNIVEVAADEPNTNYGYVRVKSELAPNVYELDHFVEKPDFETAKKFVADGHYYWNTGIYVWRASTLLEKYQTHQPETYAKLIEISQSLGTPQEAETVKTVYPTLEKISIDYAIMEKVSPTEVRIITTHNLGWSDIGNWRAVWEELTNTPEQDFTRGPVKKLETRGNLIYSDSGRTIKTLGVKDLIIVDTEDGIFIAPKSEAHRVKEIDKLDQ